MPAGPLIVIGGGEFARVVIEAAQASGWNVLGFFDPQPCEATSTRLGVPRLGVDSQWSEHYDASFVLGVGTIAVSPARERIVQALALPVYRWASVVHPNATVSPTAIIAPGAVILAGAIVMTGAEVGAYSIVNLGSCVDHDVKVGRFVHIAPNAALGGGSRVEDHAYIGMGATVRDHVAVRRQTLVGMGAVVTREYEAGEILAGVPAKPMRRET